MELLNYSLVALITILGLACGAVIGYFAKEELKPGKKYLVLLQQLLFSAIIAIVMYANRENVHFIWIGILVIFIYLYFYEKISQVFAYAVLGLSFFLASMSEMFLPAASLVFLYGFPTGSLMLKDKKNLAICIISFILVSIGLFLIKNFK